MSGGVFICYRREETAFAARAINDRVVQRLERENVFRDVDNIDLGVDWFNVLTERVGACDALVAVIGRNWVSTADKDGLRRLDDPDDFVRVEIEAALQRNVRVIPVLVDEAAMPKAGELPDSLKGLARRQGTEISPARFDADVEKLTRALVSILEARRNRDAAEADAARRAEEERRAREVSDAERAAREERELREAEAARVEEARRLAAVETARQAEEELRAQEAAKAARQREEHARREAAEAARAQEARRQADAARRAEEERRAKEAAEAERAAREEREKREATEAAQKTEQVRRQAEAETAQRVEEERRAKEAAEAERAAREERERQEAAEAAEKVAEARIPVEAKAARQSKEDDGSGLFSGTSAIEALPSPRSPPVRTYSPMIAATLAIGIAAALAILVATLGSPAWKFSAPAVDKVAEQAAADKAAADLAVADKVDSRRTTGLAHGRTAVVVSLDSRFRDSGIDLSLRNALTSWLGLLVEAGRQNDLILSSIGGDKVVDFSLFPGKQFADGLPRVSSTYRDGVAEVVRHLQFKSESMQPVDDAFYVDAALKNEPNIGQNVYIVYSNNNELFSARNKGPIFDWLLAEHLKVKIISLGACDGWDESFGSLKNFSCVELNKNSNPRVIFDILDSIIPT